MASFRYTTSSTVVALLATVGMLCADATAASVGSSPTRSSVPDSIYTGSAPAGYACPFDLSVAPVVNDGQFLTFPADSKGDVIIKQSGRIVVRFTNDDTGRTVDAEISGPGTTVVHPDGSETVTGYGPTLLVNLLSPLPSVDVVAGKTTYSVGPTGEATLVSFIGNVSLNVCATLE